MPTNAEIHSELVSLQTSLKGIQEQLSRCEAKLEGLEEMRAQVTMVEKINKDLRKEVDNLKRRDHDREQRERNSSIRVFNMELKKEEETEPLKVMDELYNKILGPILELSKAEGTIREVPTVTELLETAHILPGKGKPIIARFKSRPYRALIFKHKKSFFQKNPSLEKIAISEDLTVQMYKKAQELRSNVLVEKVWSRNGILLYTTTNEKEKIQKLKSPFDEPNLPA